jgi:hypothetical protein
MLNKALSKAIEDLLHKDGKKYIIKSEKQELKGTTLKPDVEIDITSSEVVCLELTWRSTNTKLEGDANAKQSTIGVGHIQNYVFQKVMEYVKALGL